MKRILFCLLLELAIYGFSYGYASQNQTLAFVLLTILNLMVLGVMFTDPNAPTEEERKRARHREALDPIVANNLQRFKTAYRSTLKTTAMGLPDTSRFEKEVVDFLFSKKDVIIHISDLRTYAKMTVVPWISKAVEDDQTDAYYDGMTGRDYEALCASLLRQNGWEVTETKATGDQGVDLLGRKESVFLAVQCKRHQKNVGNKAVQEIIAGKQFYGCTHAAVIAPNGFTPAARQLASSQSVILLSHDEVSGISEMI